MKKLSMIFMAVLIAALAGCAGDTTSPDGDLPVVQTLELDASSTGRTIVLVWAEVTEDIDGYKIYFQADETGNFIEVGESATTTFTHTADNAGAYVVIAYEGENTSSANSNSVSTMPVEVTGTFTIHDQNSEASSHSGFIFYDGTTYGITGLAGQETFHQDMSAYDDSKGDFEVSLWSGSQQYNEGKESFFQVPSSGEYGYCEPSGNWYISKELFTSDSVLFVQLPYTSGANAYAKLYNITITEDATNNGTAVSFSFEFQSEILGLTVFTSSVN